jgi:hypothetical protein
VRILTLLGLLWIAMGCKDAPSTKAPAPAPTLIEAEPTPSGHPEVMCDYDPTPLLVIGATQMLLDGSPVDDIELYSVLNSRQDLYSLLKAPVHEDIVLRVAKGASEKRVARALAVAGAAGFVHVTRLPDFVASEKRLKLPPSSRR